MTSLVKTVFDVSDRIHDGRTPLSILAHATSELGELAEEVAILEGHSRKEVGDDGVIGESVDTILCLLDLIRRVHPDITEADLISVAVRKCAKWEHGVNRLNKPELVFISAPYTDSDAKVVEKRMHIVREVDAYLMSIGVHTVSPLYKHEMVKQCSNVPKSWDYWREYSLNLLSQCNRMVIVPLDGWKESTGVAGELAACIERNIEYEVFDMSLLQNPSVR